MFFLLRTAFWLTLVLVLIPFGSEESESNTTPIDPVSAYFAASATVSDIGGFCSRNPQACETGGNALTAIGSRARDGARIVYEFLDTQVAGKSANEIQAPGHENAILTGSISTGTLTPEDLSTPWQGNDFSVSPEETTPIGPVPRPNPRLGSRT